MLYISTETTLAESSVIICYGYSNRSVNKVENLGYERWLINKQPRQDLGIRSLFWEMFHLNVYSFVWRCPFKRNTLSSYNFVSVLFLKYLSTDESKTSERLGNFYFWNMSTSPDNRQFNELVKQRDNTYTANEHFVCADTFLSLASAPILPIYIHSVKILVPPRLPPSPQFSRDQQARNMELAWTGTPAIQTRNLQSFSGYTFMYKVIWIIWFSKI